MFLPFSESISILRQRYVTGGGDFNTLSRTASALPIGAVPKG
jgi:hypothetical protein